MPSPILARADALMHRKRQNDADFDDVPVLTDAIGDDDDIPVLLEAVPIPPTAASPLQAVETVAQEAESPSELSPTVEEAPPQASPPTPAATTLDTEIRERLAGELARRVEQRLAAELPRIIEATVRDFLAEQEMIAASPPYN